jgi:hypothetical protein
MGYSQIQNNPRWRSENAFDPWKLIHVAAERAPEQSPHHQVIAEKAFSL